MTTLIFEDEADFLEKLRELVAQGYDWRTLQVQLPWDVPEVAEILSVPSGGLRFFAMFGGLSGFFTGLGFTIYTATSWPLITGGKPIVSLPPFLLISYILTILFGSLGTFAGFLLLARLPSIQGMSPAEEHENRFVIVLPEKEES